MEDEITQFAAEIAEKFGNRTDYHGRIDSSHVEAVRQMIIHKLKKENWIKNVDNPAGN